MSWEKLRLAYNYAPTMEHLQNVLEGGRALRQMKKQGEKFEPTPTGASWTIHVHIMHDQMGKEVKELFWILLEIDDWQLEEHLKKMWDYMPHEEKKLFSIIQKEKNMDDPKCGRLEVLEVVRILGLRRIQEMTPQDAASEVNRATESRRKYEAKLEERKAFWLAAPQLRLKKARLARALASATESQLSHMSPCENPEASQTSLKSPCWELSPHPTSEAKTEERKEEMIKNNRIPERYSNKLHRVKESQRAMQRKEREDMSACDLTRATEGQLSQRRGQEDALRIPLSLEALIAEKEEQADRELNKKEREYLSLQMEHKRILQIAASKRGKEEIGRIKAIRNRLEKIKPIEDFLKLPSTSCKSGAERNKIYREKKSNEAREEDKENKKLHMREKRTVDGHTGEKQTKKLKLGGESGNSLPLPKSAPMETVEEEHAGDILKPFPLETARDQNQSEVEVQVQDAVARGTISKGKLSANKHSNLPTKKRHQPTAKIIQSMESQNTNPEEQPVLNKQRAVEEQPVIQGREVGKEDDDMRKLIKCKQGTREGQRCTDIFWVGNLDEEGQFVLDRDIQDYFFKYVDKGYKTIWVRATVEVPIQMVSERVCEFFAKKVGMPEPWNTCIASELNITFKGKIETGQDWLSSYPEKSLFLLSKGPLPEQFKNHKGLLWQCTRKCGKAQNRRDNIIDKKCRHKFLFDKDQPNSMGRDKHRTGEDPMHIPILSRLPASLASLATPQRRVSKSFQLANIVISCSNQLTAI